MVELVDSLDSGSSVHCGRAGSSPASPTKNRSTSSGVLLFFDVRDLKGRHQSLDWCKKQSGGLFLARGKVPSFLSAVRRTVNRNEKWLQKS